MCYNIIVLLFLCVNYIKLQKDTGNNNGERKQECITLNMLEKLLNTQDEERERRKWERGDNFASIEHKDDSFRYESGNNRDIYEKR